MKIQLPTIDESDYHMIMLALSYLQELGGDNIDTADLRSYLKTDSKQV